MSGLHKPFNRHFVTLEGNLMTSGYSLNLAKGQFGLFRLDNPSVNGLSAVNNFTGAPASREYQFRLGNANLQLGRSQNNKSQSSLPFKISDIISVTASKPQITEQVVDDVVLGYNGKDASTSIVFKPGERKSIFLRLSGEYLGMLGYTENFVDIEYTMEAEQYNPFETCTEWDDCTTVDCAEIVLGAVDFLQNYELIGGIKLSEIIDITPVKDCATSPSYPETPYSFFSLTVCDAGDENALALVQAQYPDYKVIRKDHQGINSIYELIAVAGTTIADYAQSYASIQKGCEDCPDGWTEITGGEVYFIAIEDEGEDLSAEVEDLAGAVASSAIKVGQSAGVGYYTVVTDDKVTDAEITTFNTTYPTSIVEYIGTKDTICSNSTITETAWVEGDSCNISEEVYEITLADSTCGTDILTQVQAVYPKLTVVKKGTSKKVITLAGTSGTATITINGVDYTAVFDTNLPLTASNFTTANGAAIVSANEYITAVEASAETISITYNTLYEPTVTVTNTTGDLAGTMEIVELTTVTGGCNTVYQTKVMSNMVCDECSDIYKDIYKTEAPDSFRGTQWTKVEPSVSYSDCKCGIRFKSKPFEIYSDECLRYITGHVEDSVRIEVSGGYITEMREGIGRIAQEPMNVHYFTKWQPRSHVGGSMREFEDEAQWHFNGTPTTEDYLARLLKGEQSNLKPNEQVVDFAIEIKRGGYTQSMSKTGHNSAIKYYITVPYGKHSAIEALVNKIAAAAGLPGVVI